MSSLQLGSSDLDRKTYDHLIFTATATVLGHSTWQRQTQPPTYDKEQAYDKGRARAYEKEREARTQDNEDEQGGRIGTNKLQTNEDEQGERT